MTRQRLEAFARTWRRQLLARDALHAIGGAAFVGAAAWVFTPFPAFAALAALTAIFAICLAIDQPWRFDAAQLSWHLDRTYPELEESSALWLRPPEELTVLERLQRRRADAALARAETALDSRARLAAPPRAMLRRAAWWFAGGVAVFTIIWLCLPRVGQHTRASPARLATSVPRQSSGEQELRAKASVWPRITRAELVVLPPEYTHRPERRIAGFSAEVEEGAQVLWRLGLDQPMREAQLVFGEGAQQSTTFHEIAPGQFELRQIAQDTTLNHLNGTLPDGSTWNPPELYALKVQKDQPPTIAILQPPSARTEIAPPAAENAGAPMTVTVEALTNDDYAVADAHLVATVAKGTGEAVKFREQSLAFDSVEPANGADAAVPARRFLKTLDLRALGLEAGDELYFYVEASDNHPSTPNRTRSETRFILLKGQDAKPATTGRGMAGINLVPKYFRSQRQIIIDTEKLIADKPSLPDTEFRRRANDLGIDQQLLRLRYGQFLGEELEQGQGAGDHQEVSLNPLQRGIPAGVPADMVHQHDTVPAGGGDPRAGARMALRLKLEHEEQARGGADDGANHPAAGLPPTPQQIVAPFVDQHDKQDEATFFDHETKSTLRDALAAMWQAEGLLRTTRPQEALEPENTALTILKDLQQSDRAYVQRVGFEPPPLREAERRLKGDVSAVSARQIITYAPLRGSEASTQEVRAALKAAPWVIEGRTSSMDGLETLRRLAPSLTEAATRQPEKFLAGLQTLRQILANPSQAVEPDEAAVLEQSLLRLLPAAEPQPTRAVDPAPAFAESYFKALHQPEARP